MIPMQDAAADDLLVTGAVVAYWLYDIGYEIDLEHAARLTAADSAPERVRPQRQEARGLHIRNPPLALALGSHRVPIEGTDAALSVVARIYDFGVCALELQLAVPTRTSWERFGAFARAVGGAGEPIAEVARIIDDALASTRTRIAPAVERPRLAPVHEDYVVFRVSALHDRAGASVTPDALSDELLVPLLVGERRALSAAARRDLLQHRFSYYANDLTILTWDNALVIEPRDEDRDIELLLEFANAQLLELRVYDALLDARLPALYDQVEAARRRWRLWPTRRMASVLSHVQTLVADVTETVERAENALKVTEDVYLARVYEAALGLFRARIWRRGIEQKLAIFRQTYGMLNDEAQATRSEMLEALILAVIVGEVILGLVRA